MTVRTLCIAAFLAAMPLCTTAAASAPKCAPASPDAVADTMRDMYTALTKDDEASLQTIFAPDFYAIDGGKPFDGPSLIGLVKDAHKAGRTYVWTINEPKVHLQCDWAWISYVNQGSMTDTAGTKPITWLESAILHYDTNRWRIAFFHSSRAAPPQ